MADREDSMRPEGAAPDGRPRRPPPIIEGEAVEVSVDGSPAWTARARRFAAGAGPWLTRIMTVLSPRKIAAIVSAGIVCVIIAGVLWIYLAPDGSSPPRQNGASLGTAASDDVAGRKAGAEAIPQAPPLQASPSKTPENREPENRIAALDATLASLNERVAALDRIVRDSAAAARAATERADKAVRLLEEARKSGDEQEAAQRLDRGTLDDLVSRIKTLEDRQLTLRQVQERLDRLASAAAAAPDKAVRLAVVAAALRNAVERDRPFAAELAAARTIGLDEGALASLEPFATTGLPRRNELFRELSALLPELRRVSVPAGQDLGYLDRIQASAVRMLNIRPVKDEPGDDPSAVLSRIELRMVHEDFEAVVAELDKLPSQAKELARRWRTTALARRDAVEAARLVATASLAKLGEPAASGPSPQ